MSLSEYSGPDPGTVVRGLCDVLIRCLLASTAEQVAELAPSGLGFNSLSLSEYSGTLFATLAFVPIYGFNSLSLSEYSGTL